THKSNAQLICKAYQEATDVGEDLKGDPSGDFEDLLVALITPPAVYDCVMRAMKGAGTKDHVLIEMFASRSNQQIKALKDICLMKRVTEESKFINILCQRSIPQLRQTLVEYKNISGSLQRSIERAMSGELEELLGAVVKCFKSIPGYFGEHIHEKMKGGGTDESTLSRIVVTRSEIDLLDIRDEFKKLYEHCLLCSCYQKKKPPFCGTQAKPDVDGASEVPAEYGECMKAICGGDDRLGVHQRPKNPSFTL
ncbi:LOW QUALITY PROTEIN: annexin A3a, partial [Xenentodon cancila]